MILWIVIVTVFVLFLYFCLSLLHHKYEELNRGVRKLENMYLEAYPEELPECIKTNQLEYPKREEVFRIVTQANKQTVDFLKDYANDRLVKVQVTLWNSNVRLQEAINLIIKELGEIKTEAKVRKNLKAISKTLDKWRGELFPEPSECPTEALIKYKTRAEKLEEESK